MTGACKHEDRHLTLMRPAPAKRTAPHSSSGYELSAGAGVVGLLKLPGRLIPQG
jgi:hypothetical protein